MATVYKSARTEDEAELKEFGKQYDKFFNLSVTYRCLGESEPTRPEREWHPIIFGIRRQS